MKVYIILLLIMTSTFLNGQERKYPENFGDIFLKKKRKKIEAKHQLEIAEAEKQIQKQIDSLRHSSGDYTDQVNHLEKEVERIKRSSPKPYAPLLLGKDIFKGDIGYSLSKVSYRDASNELKGYYRHTARINFNINPWRDFYIKNTFFIDLNKSDISPPWLANYFYQIGYYNWRNKTFSFGYENYQPNKWDGFFEDFFTNFKRGYLFVSFNYFLETPKDRKHLKPLFWDETSRFVISPLLRIHPEYQNNMNELGGYFKPILGTTLRYVIIKNIYLETGLFYYPIQKTKLMWDPDFTYGFGISDWRAFKVNFTYGNWIANRFPWNDKEMDYYNFLNGEFTLYLTYSW